MKRADLSEALISMLGAGNVRTGELMKTHTTFRIGGAADYYVTPQAEKQIADVIAFLKKSDMPFLQEHERCGSLLQFL